MTRDGFVHRSFIHRPCRDSSGTASLTVPSSTVPAPAHAPLCRHRCRGPCCPRSAVCHHRLTPAAVGDRRPRAWPRLARHTHRRGQHRHHPQPAPGSGHAVQRFRAGYARPAAAQDNYDGRPEGSLIRITVPHRYPFTRHHVGGPSPR